MSFIIKKKFERIENKEIKGTIKNISIKDEFIQFKSKDKDENAIENINNNRKIIKYLKKNIISLIGVIIIILIMINFNYCFININFKSYNNNNYSVNEYFEKYYYSIGPFKYLNNNLEIINNDLKSHFYEYEWINVTKKGINVNIEIKNKDELIEKENNNIYGDLIALKDGIIVNSYIENGVNLVNKFDYVKENQVLVSGNLLYKTGKVKYTKAKGIVIANTYTILEQKIIKQDINIERSGKVQVIKKNNLFLNTNINCKYENYETEIKKGKYFFSNTYIYCYELIEVKRINEYQDGIEIAKNNIYSEFNNKKIHKDERIEECTLLSFYEDDEYYYFECLVKAYENIAIFKEVLS